MTFPRFTLRQLEAFIAAMSVFLALFQVNEALAAFVLLVAAAAVIGLGFYKRSSKLQEIGTVVAIVAVLLMLLIPASHSAGSGSRSLQIQITIVDKVSGKPVEGATVHVDETGYGVASPPITADAYGNANVVRRVGVGFQKNRQLEMWSFLVPAECMIRITCDGYEAYEVPLMGLVRTVTPRHRGNYLSLTCPLSRTKAKPAN